MQDVFFGPEETKLHGVLLASDTSGAAGAVICHPHPEYGGSMDNNVVLGVEAALADAGLTTLRFNFRGVGRSRGAFAGGAGEIDDVTRAVDLLAADSSMGDIHVVGYSFGAAVGLKAAMSDDRVSALVGIAPPTAIDPFAFLADNTKPLLLIAGSRDDFCDPKKLGAFVKQPTDKLEIIPGADHFFFMHENRIGDLVKEFLLSLRKDLENKNIQA